MRLLVNIDDELIMAVNKGSLKKGSLVTVIDHLGWDRTTCKVADKHGNEEIVLMEDICYFADINGVLCLKGKPTMQGDTETYQVQICITTNVRSSDDIYEDKGRRYTISPKKYEYLEQDLTDEDVVKILLDDVLYGEQPHLESTSLVGSNSRFIDCDPNYHNGHYILNNGKEYTMSYCGGIVRIREGHDGGWYFDKEKAGKTLLDAKIDYLRLQDAIIRRECKRELKNINFFEEHPEILTLLYEKLKVRESCSLKN